MEDAHTHCGLTAHSPEPSEGMGRAAAHECALSDELPEASNRYEIKELLGRGTSGKVYLAWDRGTSRYVALKVMKRGVDPSNEISSLRLLNQIDRNGCYFVKLLHCCTWQGKTCLVFEYLAKNLYEVIEETNFYGLPLANVKVFAWQVLTALSLLDEARILHRDLKPENIMLAAADKAGVKLIDFSSACSASASVTGTAQSRYYRAPEVLRGEAYSSAVDMWSLGCVLAELHTGRPLFPGRNSEHQLSKIENFAAKGGVDQFLNKYALWPEDAKASQWFSDLLEGLLEETPERRLRPTQALAHSFFTEDAALFRGETHSRKSSYGSPVSKLSTDASSPPSRLSSCELDQEAAHAILFN